MGACGCTFQTVPGSLEFQRRYKPENNSGCCCTTTGDCSTPSRAVEGSPRADWEAIYGKLVTTITQTFDAQGHNVWLIERTACPIETVLNEKPACCSFRYKVVR